MPFTADELAALEERFADIVRQGGTQVELIANIVVATCSATIDHCEELVRRSPYRGVWKVSEHYLKDDLITHKGSAWACLQDCEGSPPPGLAWQLAVKRGSRR